MRKCKSNYILQITETATNLLNSRDIFSMVSPVGKDELKEGDLVFFKIHSRSISHVGIYLGDGRFAHASMKGVAISSLDDPYYNRYFYKGGRLLDVFKEQLEKSSDVQ
jgi:lipoprotein Spr